MKNPFKNSFKTAGFDTIIGKDVCITGRMVLSGTTVLDGHFDGEYIGSDPNAANAVNPVKTTLLVNGTVSCESVILADDLSINGAVNAGEIRVSGVLSSTRTPRSMLPPSTTVRW
jgi:cytoskeletal protein CcmA (bactofilin family)